MEHYGVYGVWLQNGLVVAIRKARAPYFGMLDLPGETSSLGESIEFHHSGLVALVTVQDEVNFVKGVADTQEH